MNLSLNYHHLRYFRAVATAGALGLAARKLGVSQSSVSSQIRQLEQTLGHQLFDRQHKSLILTEAGRIALEYADAIFRQGDELVGVLNNVSGARRRVLRVGTVATISRNFLMERLRPVLEQPHIEVVQRSGGLGDLLSRLASHMLDVVLSNQPAMRDAASAFHTHLLSSQKVSLVGPARSKGGKFRFPTDLEHYPLLLPSQENALRAAFDLILERHRIHPRILAEADDMATLRLLATEGVGLALVPPVVVRMELQNGTLKELHRFNDLEEHFYAITVSTRFPSDLTALVLQMHRP